ncbi:MAG: hypothetical protein IKU79_05140 [Bacteroidaceae bacterium]|nr:hypothetical protein [Bacteroidaceae bacterium]
MEKNNIVISNHRRKILKYFIFVFFIIPMIEVSGLTTVINRFIPNILGYNLLVFVLSLPLLRSFNKNYGNLKGTLVAITLLITYLIITFIVTVGKTSFYASIQVFRYSYMQALNLFILLPFIFSLKKDEVNYVLNGVFRCLIVFTIIYLSNNLGYDWMGVKGNLSESQGGVSVDRSIIGMPLFDPLWTSLLFVYTMMKVPNANKYLMLILLTLLISFTRNIFFSTLIVATVVIILSILKNSNQFGRSVKMLAATLLGIVVLSVIMPSAIDFWIAKLSSTFNEDLKHDMGTFAFREQLIADAIYAIRHNPLFGLGYIRDVAKGEYSMVMGGDTYIAPILWCEGWIGIILRTLPFAILCRESLSNLFKKKRIYWLDIIVIACIVASSVNYVQTKALTNYPLILGIIIMFKIKENYDRKTQDFGNYSII